MKRIVLLTALVLGMLVVPSGYVQAGGDPPPPFPPNAGDGIRADARVVDTVFLDRCAGNQDPNSPCWYVVYEAGPSSAGGKAGLSVAGTSTYQCALRVWNSANVHVATLTNNTTAELRTIPPLPRWKLISGYNSTWKATGYS